ncbi:MAG: hypothetical protein ACE5FN_00980 [Leptospirillia bacterium]
MYIRRLILAIGALCCCVALATPASAAGIYDVDPGVTVKTTKSAKSVARERQLELLSKLVGFVTKRMDLHVGKSPDAGFDMAHQPGAMPMAADIGLGNIEATFDLGTPVLTAAGGTTVERKLPLSSSLSVSRDRVRLMFKLRW